jgi:hypothetical protein
MAGNTKAMGVAYRDQLIAGTTTNDNALAGDVGEYIVSTVASGSAVSITTGTPTNITSIALTPGDWDLDAVIDFLPAASTSITNYQAAYSLTSATLSTQPGGSGLGPDPLLVVNQAAMVPAAVFGCAPATVRLTISANTTVYLVAQSTFSVSTLTGYGTLRARRAR